MTRSERTEALEALRDWKNSFGDYRAERPDCPHQDDAHGVPACETEEVCIGIVVQRWRQQRAMGQQRALVGVAS